MQIHCLEGRHKSGTIIAVFAQMLAPMFCHPSSSRRLTDSCYPHAVPDHRTDPFNTLYRSHPACRNCAKNDPFRTYFPFLIEF